MKQEYTLATVFAAAVLGVTGTTAAILAVPVLPVLAGATALMGAAYGAAKATGAFDKASEKKAAGPATYTAETAAILKKAGAKL